MGNNALQSLRVDNRETPIQQMVDEIFGSQYGRILNSHDFQSGVDRLNQLYRDNGYALSQVVELPDSTSDGIVTLPTISDGSIEDVQVRFLSEEGQTIDKEGNPIRGITPESQIIAQVQSKVGEVFNRERLNT